MSGVTPFPDLDAAREEASQWIARTFRGLTADEHAALREWSRRPVNRRAMAEMSGIWSGLDVLSVLSDLFPRDASVVIPVAPVPVRRRHWRGVAIAAGTACVLAIAGTVALMTTRPVAQLAAVTRTQDPVTTYTSTVGERRTIPLSDGSVLSLNTGAQVAVTFGAGQRRLELQRGEAHFEVAPDAARPFVVTVNGRAVRAIGTGFNIRRRSDAAIEVLVTHGVVRAYDPAALARIDDEAAGDRLEAGELLRIGEDGRAHVSRVANVELDALIAWRRGVLVLDGITLEAAMTEISRYTTRSIVIDDASLHALRLGGSFPTNDLAAVLRALKANFGIEAREATDGAIHLTR